MAVTAPPATIETKPASLSDPNQIAEQIKIKYANAVESASAQGIVIKNARLLNVARYLHDDLNFDNLHNVTSVDWPDRFEVIYHVSSIERGGAPLTLKVNAEREDPTVPSLMPIYRGADFQEREVYDMMGIPFLGHPNLRRILMWDWFAGYPLRKDYHEAYYEKDHKPFGTRWDQGHRVIAEERNPWHDNVVYPENSDAKRCCNDRRNAYSAPGSLRWGDFKSTARLKKTQRRQAHNRNQGNGKQRLDASDERMWSALTRVGKFDEATWHLFNILGITPTYIRDHERGMVAVEQQISYKRELLAGDTIAIRSGILEIKEKVIRFCHEMQNEETGEIAAITVLTGVHLDRRARKACPFPEDVLARGREMIVKYDPGI